MRRPVRQLAKLTRESKAGAIINWINRRLDRLRRQPKAGLAERLVGIGKECAPRFKEQLGTIEHGDLLYGEDGLPK
jgi:antitoxin VapB